MTNHEIRKAFVQREPVFIESGGLARAGKITSVDINSTSGEVVSIEFTRDTGGSYNVGPESFDRLYTQSQIERLFDKYGFGLE